VVSHQATAVSTYLKSEAMRLAKLRPEEFVSGFREAIERICLDQVDKPEEMRSMLALAADTKVTAINVDRISVRVDYPPRNQP
jgi:hypothetical protein